MWHLFKKIDNSEKELKLKQLNDAIDRLFKVNGVLSNDAKLFIFYIKSLIDNNFVDNDNDSLLLAQRFGAKIVIDSILGIIALNANDIIEYMRYEQSKALEFKRDELNFRGETHGNY